MKKQLAFIIPYFGRWPEWIDLFIESCKYNPQIDWIFFTDCEIPANTSDNCIFNKITFDEYKKLVSDKLEIDFNPDNAYKLCDLKPTYGFIHKDILTNYKFFGFGDLDIIWGDIDKFLDKLIFEKYDFITTHNNRIGGHFCALRNNEMMRNAFRQIKNWQSLLENKQHLGIDESKFTKVFLKHRKHPKWLRKIYGLFDKYQRRTYFKEQYSTIMSPIKWWNGKIEHPTEWIWKKGKLTNSEDGNKEFMYLHFMNYKSSMWLPKELKQKAPWENLDKLNFVDFEDINAGFKINKAGFYKI